MSSRVIIDELSRIADVPDSLEPGDAESNVMPVRNQSWCLTPKCPALLLVGLRQKPLSEVDPLLQLRDAGVQRIHLTQSHLQLIDLGPESRISGILSFQTPAEGSHDRPEDDNGCRQGGNHDQQDHRGSAIVEENQIGIERRRRRWCGGPMEHHWVLSPFPSS